MSSVSAKESPKTDGAWAAKYPESRRLFERALRTTPGGVHHNLRATSPFPLFFARGQGAYKWDVDGHRYVDYALGQGSLILGHSHPSVVEAVTGEHLAGVPGAGHALEVRWAEIGQRSLIGGRSSQAARSERQAQ